MSGKGSPSEERPPEELSYEQAFAELEAIVTALEEDDHPLEQAIALFERGQALARRCAELLETAELKVRQLVGDELEDFSPRDEQ